MGTEEIGPGTVALRRCGGREQPGQLGRDRFYQYASGKAPARSGNAKAFLFASTSPPHFLNQFTTLSCLSVWMGTISDA